VWAAPVAAAIALVADLALTGMLHMDGLVDAADGLLPHLPRPRRLEVMAEPTVGAYGVTVAGAVLLLRFAAFAAVRPDVGMTAAVWCASRTVMAVAARAMPYARTEGGLASAMKGRRWQTVAGYGVVGAVALASLGGLRTVAAVLAAFVGGGAVLLVGQRKLGGFTGDVLGAAGVVGETLGLVMAAIR
jgi:adenosylcobinamide-GDP ribazoletransferase